jgi:hypothetical protein
VFEVGQTLHKEFAPYLSIISLIPREKRDNNYDKGGRDRTQVRRVGAAIALDAAELARQPEMKTIHREVDD